MYVGELRETGIVEGMEVIREKVFLEAVEACMGEIAEAMDVPLSSLSGRRIRVKKCEPEVQKAAVGRRKKHIKKEEQVEQKIKSLVEGSAPEDEKSSRKRKKMRPGKSLRASKRTMAKRGKGKGKGKK
jgi:hypothetical protein